MQTFAEEGTCVICTQPGNVFSQLGCLLGALLVSSVGEAGAGTFPWLGHRRDTGWLSTGDVLTRACMEAWERFMGLVLPNTCDPTKMQHRVPQSLAGSYMCSLPIVCGGTLFSPLWPNGQWLLFLKLACLIKELLLAHSMGWAGMKAACFGGWNETPNVSSPAERAIKADWSGCIMVARGCLAEWALLWVKTTFLIFLKLLFAFSPK